MDTPSIAPIIASHKYYTEIRNNVVTQFGTEILYVFDGRHYCTRIHGHLSKPELEADLRRFKESRFKELYGGVPQK